MAGIKNWLSGSSKSSGLEFVLLDVEGTGLV